MTIPHLEKEDYIIAVKNLFDRKVARRYDLYNPKLKSEEISIECENIVICCELGGRVEIMDFVNNLKFSEFGRDDITRFVVDKYFLSLNFEPSHIKLENFTLNESDYFSSYYHTGEKLKAKFFDAISNKELFSYEDGDYVVFPFTDVYVFVHRDLYRMFFITRNTNFIYSTITETDIESFNNICPNMFCTSVKGAIDKINSL